MTKFLNFLLLFSAMALAQTSEDLIRDVIADPSVSLRCKELIKERNQKVRVKQQTQALIRRANKTRELAPVEKRSIKRKLERSSIKLEQNLFYINKRIASMEDYIIRRGCPGMTL